MNAKINKFFLIITIGIFGCTISIISKKVLISGIDFTRFCLLSVAFIGLFGSIHSYRRIYENLSDEEETKEDKYEDAKSTEIDSKVTCYYNPDILLSDPDFFNTCSRRIKSFAKTLDRNFYWCIKVGSDGYVKSAQKIDYINYEDVVVTKDIISVDLCGKQYYYSRSLDLLASPQTIRTINQHIDQYRNGIKIDVDYAPNGTIQGYNFSNIGMGGSGGSGSVTELGSGGNKIGLNTSYITILSQEPKKYCPYLTKDQVIDFFNKANAELNIKRNIVKLGPTEYVYNNIEEIKQEILRCGYQFGVFFCYNEEKKIEMYVFDGTILKRVDSDKDFIIK